jgi:hypothetical protein
MIERREKHREIYLARRAYEKSMENMSRKSGSSTVTDERGVQAFGVPKIYYTPEFYIEEPVNIVFVITVLKRRVPIPLKSSHPPLQTGPTDEPTTLQQSDDNGQWL